MEICFIFINKQFILGPGELPRSIGHFICLGISSIQRAIGGSIGKDIGRLSEFQN